VPNPSSQQPRVKTAQTDIHLQKVDFDDTYKNFNGLDMPVLVFLVDRMSYGYWDLSYEL